MEDLRNVMPSSATILSCLLLTHTPRVNLNQVLLFLERFDFLTTPINFYSI